MKFLIDGHRDRVAARAEQWPSGVLGQLLTPLTRYSCAPAIPFAIDNGAYSELRFTRWLTLLERERIRADRCLFVVIPDKVGCARTSWQMFEEYNGYAVGFKTAFVAQDGYFGMPASADTLFIGGTDRFKDSEAAKEACRLALGIGKRVHVGRVNGAARFYSWYKTGATTCDGSGVSRYDHMILRIRELIEKELHNEQT